MVKGTITVTKKTFTADDFDPPNNTEDNATATNNANNNSFGEKKLFFLKWFLKIMHHLSIVFQKLMV